MTELDQKGVLKNRNWFVRSRRLRMVFYPFGYYYVYVMFIFKWKKPPLRLFPLWPLPSLEWLSLWNVRLLTKNNALPWVQFCTACFHFSWVKSILVTPSPGAGTSLSYFLSSLTSDPKHPDAVGLTRPNLAILDGPQGSNLPALKLTVSGSCQGTAPTHPKRITNNGLVRI